jgi:predicted alpha/beta superfamily hydrolase
MPSAASAVARIVEDVAAIVHAFGRQVSCVAGQDFGGGVVWATAMIRPDLVLRLATLNSVHPVGFPAADPQVVAAEEELVRLPLPAALGAGVVPLPQGLPVRAPLARRRRPVTRGDRRRPRGRPASRPLVVVGIENTERRRDLVSQTAIEEERKIAPHAGGTDRFRRFIGEELEPEIARRYRVSDESAVVGESFVGLFVLETLLQDPDLFDAYIAIDPSVWWNGGALVKSAPGRFSQWKGRAKPKRFFVATADAKEMQEGVSVLMAALRDRQPQGLTGTYEPFPAEHHNTIFAVAEVRAYRALFAESAR